MAALASLVLWGEHVAHAELPNGAPLPLGEVLNLYDDFGADRPGVVFDFGFAALVRYGETTILFDTGSHAAVLRENVRALGVDLREVDIVVLSHQHPDHHGGMAHVLAAHPDVQVYAPRDRFIGGPASHDPLGPDPDAAGRLPPDLRYRERPEGGYGIVTTGMFGLAPVRYVDRSMEIAKGVTLVYTRASQTGYYDAYPPHERSPRLSGLPELSLSVATEAGEVLIVGCSHSGVVAIVEATQRVTGRPITLLFGGFHLIPLHAPQVDSIVRRLRQRLGVARVAPAHCTGHLGFESLRRAFGSRFVRAGLGDRVPL